ncbi:MAG TPA: tyrosine-type recombinase/integrase [Tissierellales bacterium]|nr:tyrosine-type recombinase/integrase [Tissierellales bacterium]
MTRQVLYNEETYNNKVNKDSKAVVNDYIMELKSRGLSEKTIYQYIADIKAFLVYVHNELDNKYILDIKRKEFRRFFLWMQDNKKSNARINRMQSSLRNILEYCEMDDDDYEDYTRNQMKGIKSLEKKEVREIFFLTDDQIDFLVNYLLDNGKYQKALYVELSYSSGARRNEISQVTKYPFLNNENITNTITGKRGKEFKLLYSNKSKKIAKLYLEERGEDDIDSLWITGKGDNKRPLKYTSLYDWVVSFRKILNDKYKEEINLNPHSLRHSFAQNMADGTHHMLKELDRDKLTLNEVRILMQHESVDMTQSYMKNEDDKLIENLSLQFK